MDMGMGNGHGDLGIFKKLMNFEWEFLMKPVVEWTIKL